MQRLEVSCAVRPIYGSLGVKRLNNFIPVSELPHFISCAFLVLFGQTYVESDYHIRIILSVYINVFLFIRTVDVHMCMRAHLHT